MLQMSAEDFCNYDQLKAAMLRRFNINDETYQVRFRAVMLKSDEAYAKMATRVMDLLWK